jgi:hypothetical protein
VNDVPFPVVHLMAKIVHALVKVVAKLTGTEKACSSKMRESALVLLRLVFQLRKARDTRDVDETCLAKRATVI